MTSDPRGAPDSGAAGVVTLFSVVLFCVAAVAGLAAAGDLSLTWARARAAADAAALAGAATSPLVSPASAETAHAAASTVAAANRARLVREDSRHWPLRYGVTVEVQPRTRWVARLVGPVRAVAVAAVRPRVPAISPLFRDGNSRHARLPARARRQQVPTSARPGV